MATVTHQPFGHLYIEPKPPVHAAFWIGAPREGFTEFCARMCDVAIPVEDVTEQEAQIILRRQDVLATLIGIQQATSNQAIRSAVIVRRARAI